MYAMRHLAITVFILAFLTANIYAEAEYPTGHATSSRYPIPLSYKNVADPTCKIKQLQVVRRFWQTFRSGSTHYLLVGLSPRNPISDKEGCRQICPARETLAVDPRAIAAGQVSGAARMAESVPSRARRYARSAG